MTGHERQAEVLPNLTIEVRLEAAGYQNVRHYVQNIASSYQDYDWWHDNVPDFLLGIEPEDACGMVNPERPITRNILYGMLLGLRVTEIGTNNRPLLGEIAADILHTRFDIDFSAALDQRDRQHMTLEVIKDLGEKGLKSGDPNLGLATGWETDLCPDISVSSFVTTAFGMVIYKGQQVRSTRNRQLLTGMAEDMLQGRFDWDSGLAELSLT